MNRCAICFTRVCFLHFKTDCIFSGLFYRNSANYKNTMFLLLITAFWVLLIIFWYIQWKHKTANLKQFSGPTPLPIFGNALNFSSTSDILPKYLKFHETHGKTILLTVGFAPAIISTTDPKFIEYITGSTTLIDKARDYRFLHNWVGTGLLTSTGVKWKNHRRILTPAFHFRILEQFIAVFHDYGDIFIKKLKAEVDKDSVNIYPFVTLCTLDVICAATMGININAQQNSYSEYVKSVKHMCRILFERTISALKMNDVLYKFSNDYQIEKKAIKILHDTTYSVINNRKEQLKKEAKDKITKNADEEISKRKTFLDILLTYKEEYGDITDENIREEVDTFMFGGHDTTASAITFTLYCLAKNSDVQTKVIEELAEILENDFGKLISYKELQRMKYLEMVIKESLRMYAPVPLYARNVAKEFKYGESIFPKNTSLLINAFCLHRNPEFYPNPESFDPKRFTLENQLRRSAYEYIPFSAGSRNCIGQKFAMLEMKAMISKVLINFELLPSIPEVKLVLASETILKSKTGVHIRLKHRKL